MRFGVEDGRIVSIDVVADPERLDRMDVSGAGDAGWPPDPGWT
jgi:hypothetical protein